MHTHDRSPQTEVARPGVLLIGALASSPLRAALEDARFRVVAARGGAYVIADAATCGAVEAIVLDSDADGPHALDVVSYLRHRFPRAALLLLVPAGADIVERAALGRGASGCLHKPIGSAAIVAGVVRAMSGAAGSRTRAPSAYEAGAREPAATVLPPAGRGREDRGDAPLWAVVLAGGEGRRLRPLVQHIHAEARPKQYATLVGSRSLLGGTLDRVRLGIPLARTVVVALKRHRRFVDAERAAGHVPTTLMQPADRGTAPGVLLPVRCILAREPRATVAVFPSDHFVEPARRFMTHVGDAACFVDRHPERIVLVGIEATEAETEYGWIEPSAPLGRAGQSEFWSVGRFVEKPSAAGARACLANGALWNTFVIVARAATLIEAARQLVPGVHERLESAVPFLGTAWETPALRRVYAAIPNTSLSTALLERCTPLLAVSRLYGVRWYDWGSPRRVIQSLHAEALRPPWLDRFTSTRAAISARGAGRTSAAADGRW